MRVFRVLSDSTMKKSAKARIRGVRRQLTFKPGLESPLELQSHRNPVRPRPHQETSSTTLCWRGTSASSDRAPS